MFYLTHGEDFTKIDQEVSQQVKGGFIRLSNDLNVLEQHLRSNHLFSLEQDREKYLVRLDNAKIFGDIETLEKYKDSSVEVHFYHYGKLVLKPKQKKLFNKNNEYKIADNKEIFQFLDNLLLGNSSKALKFIEVSAKDGQDIYIYHMILYSLKNILYYYKDPTGYKKLHPYVQSKTLSYANRLRYKDVTNCLTALAQADIKTKSGGDPKTLMTSLVYYITSL